jgi:hypothetical protein
MELNNLEIAPLIDGWLVGLYLTSGGAVARDHGPGEPIGL